MSVTTRTKDEAVGARLEYDYSGVITSEESVARAVGTTVAISKLFSPLPVRYKEFNRNIRREYGRLLSVLQVSTEPTFSLLSLSKSGSVSCI